MTEISPGRVAQTRLRKLEAEATHAQQRVDLYRLGTRQTRPDRLKKLERLSELAQSRLAEARSAQISTGQGETR